MAGVRLTLKGGDFALGAINAALERLANPQPMFADIGLSLVASTQRRFEQGRGPDGAVWPPSIRALTEGGKTLIDSARLMQSISYVAGRSGVEVGTNVVYAAIHQFGGTIHQAARQGQVHFATSKRTGKRLKGFRKAGKAAEHRTVEIGARDIAMPARPFLGLDDDDEREIGRIVGDWILTGPLK